MPRRQSKKLRQAGRSQAGLLLVLVILFSLVAVVAVNRQNLYDWLKLRSYHAPEAVVGMASQDTLTPYARKVFYVNEPTLEDKVTFTSKCPSSSREQTIVLGCYHGNQHGIFLLDVTDSRLDGIEQVTAAHEMLHAAYDRLSSSERRKVDQMLLNYYQHSLADERIKKTIDAYRQTEPKELVNEMHSIFGTEIVSLPTNLEQYYARYFTDRSQVAAFAARYQSEFSSRSDAVKRADAQLASLKSQINSAEDNLKAKQAQIENRRTSLLALRSSGDVSAYNAGVAPYNALVDSYNTDVQNIQNLINQYNALVSQRNAIALEEGELVNELKTNVAPIQQ